MDVGHDVDGALKSRAQLFVLPLPVSSLVVLKLPIPDRDDKQRARCKENKTPIFFKDLIELRATRKAPSPVQSLPVQPNQQCFADLATEVRDGQIGRFVAVNYHLHLRRKDAGERGQLS